jgi:hypothetical protein
MSWPWIEDLWPAFIINLPMVFLCIRSFGNDKENEPGFRLLLGVFTWLVLHAGAIAYMRALHGYVPSRYTDISSLIVVANFVAITMVLRSSNFGKHKNLALAFNALWCFLIILGSAQLLKSSIDKIEDKRTHGLEQVENLRDYFSTGDPEIITARSEYDPSLPFPRPKLLLPWLDDPAIRNLFPVELYDQGKYGSMVWFREGALSNGVRIVYIGIFLLLIHPFLSFSRRMK